MSERLLNIPIALLAATLIATTAWSRPTSKYTCTELLYSLGYLQKAADCLSFTEPLTKKEMGYYDEALECIDKFTPARAAPIIERGRAHVRAIWARNGLACGSTE